ncbi:putative protein kinase RLK-Pelle-LRR-VII-2 family [Helianthus annuus]|nr:putative protein kinase RLK-Pelle-LRR-VII-2 family [Helianthus annuus]
MGFALLGSIFILTLFLKSNLGQQQEQPIPNSDEFFISQFFEKMGMNSSKSYHLYNLSTPLCSWQVVVCDSKQQNVIGLVAPSLNLTGPIPDNTIGKLKKLQFLDLNSNHITGFSSDFWSLVSLKSLNLSNNKFSDNIPTNIGNFGSLEKLDLSFNNFNGSLPKGFATAFPSLKRLNLAGNLVNGRGFDFSKMVSLTYLNVSKNLFKGSVVEIFQGPLEIIDLSSNHFEGHISQLPYMERFNFSYNNLTLCDSDISLETLRSAFIGSTNSCPIAANPTLFKKEVHKHRGLKLGLGLGISLICFLICLLLFAFGYGTRTIMWDVKESWREENIISGPFSFKTDSTTWVADVKVASLVPVVIFEKPLLNFTFSDLLSATSKFSQDTLLAEGRFGPVYHGFLGGAVHVAIKVLVHGSTMTDQEAANELEYLGRIKHPNLVPLMGYCLAGEQRIMIYDYMENGNLHNLLYDLPLGVHVSEDWSTDTWEDQETNENGIRNVGPEASLMTWRFRHKIGLGTARALAFLHHGCSPPIVHRDVKASSVYLDYNLEPRLSDFGLSKIFGNGVSDDLTNGSAGYVTPGSVVTPKSDVYGFGVVLLELITGKKPVGDEYPNDENQKVQDLVSWVRGLVRVNRGSQAIDPKIRATGDEGEMVEGLKIGYLCTADDPLKRPSMQQVVGLLKDIEPVV